MTQTTLHRQMRYSLWLGLAPGSSEPVQKVIDTLAIQHTSLTFSAHMTICSGLTGSIDQLKITVTRFAQSQQAVFLLGKQFSSRKTLFQSLFIELELDDRLEYFHQNAVKALDQHTPSSAGFFPHISLAYLDPTSFDASSQIKQLDKRLLQKIHGNRLVLMETSGDQNSWKQILELKLSEK